MCQGDVEGKAPKIVLSFTPRRPLETLIFKSIIVLLLLGNTSFNTYRMLMKAQLLLRTKCAKSGGNSYLTILNIKKFDAGLKHFLFKIKRNDNVLSWLLLLNARKAIFFIREEQLKKK